MLTNRDPDGAQHARVRDGLERAPATELQSVVGTVTGVVATVLGVIVGMALGILAGAFGVFLMRQFIAGIPDDYLAAARVDGTGKDEIKGSDVLVALFDEADLPYPPHKIGEQYDGKDWTWETVRELALQLTVDTDGNDSAWPFTVSVHDTSDGRLALQIADIAEGFGVFPVP